MLEDSPLKLLQLPPRLQPELVDESIACSPKHVEGVGLASGPVQREHQVAAQALPERLLCHEPLELGHELCPPTAHEFRLDARLHRPKPKLLKPPRLDAGQRLVEQIDPRRPTPQRERLGQRRPRSGVIAGLGCAIGGPDQPLEPIDVELARLDREQVAAGARGAAGRGRAAFAAGRRRHRAIRRRLEAGALPTAPGPAHRAKRPGLRAAAAPPATSAACALQLRSGPRSAIPRAAQAPKTASERRSNHLHWANARFLPGTTTIIRTRSQRPQGGCRVNSSPNPPVGAPHHARRTRPGRRSSRQDDHASWRAGMVEFPARTPSASTTLADGRSIEPRDLRRSDRVRLGARGVGAGRKRPLDARDQPGHAHDLRRQRPQRRRRRLSAGTPSR